MMTHKKLLFGAIGLQVAILLWILLSRILIFTFGSELSLIPRPYDPRDIFYGDYVQMRFDINTYTSQHSTEYQYMRGQPVYAVLQKTRSDWSVKYLSKTIPGERPFLKGIVTTVYGSTVEIEYGFERYYVPEGTGQTVTDTVRDGRARLIIATSPLGDSVVKHLE
jgi:uncharacterized membrane-anchored protein